MILILAWVLCAFWAKSLARKNGHDPRVAFWAGMFFGIFAVMHYSKPPRNHEVYATYRLCANCGGRLYVRYTPWICPTCHRRNHTD